MIVDTTPGLMKDSMSAMKFRMHTDAQLSVLFSLAGLITSRNEVLEEYDRMIAMLQSKAPGTVGATILLESRESLIDLMKNAMNH